MKTISFSLCAVLIAVLSYAQAEAAKPTVRLRPVKERIRESGLAGRQRWFSIRHGQLGNPAGYQRQFQQARGVKHGRGKPKR